MYIINNQSKPSPFLPSHYLKERSSVSFVPFVSKLSISEIDTDNLKCIEIDCGTNVNISNTACEFHKQCKGHLTTSHSRRVSFPDFMLSRDIVELSTIDIIHRRILNYVGYDKDGDLNSIVQDLGTAISGRRGIFKYSLMGCRSSNSARGVATCAWPEDFRTVYIPRAWMANMGVMKFEESDRDGTYFVSSYPKFTRIKDGTYALLGRCPTLSENSLQSVRLYAWDNPSIGVHPNMCIPTNLDYDGDEVHIFPMSSRNSIEEIIKFGNTAYKYKFQRSDMFNDPGTRREYFLRSTRSITLDYDLESNEANEVSDMVRNKTSAWKSIKGYYNRPEDMISGFISLTHQRVQSMIYSKMKVSEGHVYGRQLRNVLFQVTSEGNTLRSSLSMRGSPDDIMFSIPPVINSAIGYPGVRLTYEFSMKLTQKLLDMAKHTADRYDKIASIDSLLSNGPMETFTYGRSVLPMSRKLLATIDNELERFLACVTSMSVACFDNNIVFDTIGIQEVAFIIYLSTLIKKCPSITGTTVSKFMSKFLCNPLLVGMSEDLRGMDMYLSDIDDDYECNFSVSNPICAMITGNLRVLEYRSLRHSII
ncbi:hypothetical protein HDV02_002477 [Globomyces sp. JEL0801]|nr:hypothetical protein HDV02_002477 [Globomyces sp. JEL0801]